MPADPVLVRSDVISEGGGHHDIVIDTKYEAPVDASGTAIKDDYKEKDIEAATDLMLLLRALYPGYPWATQVDGRQGIAKISIPILMGVNRWYVINLPQTGLTPQAIVKAGGEILERYRQRRGRLQIGSFLEAREKHSALVVPSRQVPG